MTQIKLIPSSVSILIAFTMLLLCSNSRALETYKIGVLIDLSGLAAYVGEQYRIGAEIARDELSKEGLTIELVLGDHTLSTKTAVTEAERMIFVNKIDALFSNGSGPSSAVSPIAAKHKKLMIYSGAAVSPLQNNEYAFKTFTDFKAGCQALAQKYLSSGIKSVGVLKLEIEPGELCLEGVQTVFPEATVQPYKPGQEVRTQVLLMKNKGLQAIINPGYEADLLNLLKSSSFLGYKGLIGTYADGLTDKVRKRYAPLLPRITTFGMPEVPASLKDKIAKRYPNKDFSSLEGAALTYLHIKQLGKVLSKCSRGDIVCQTELLSRSVPEKTIKFKGWKNRVAVFDLSIKEWR